MSEAESDLIYENFVRARKLHWISEAKSIGSNVVLPEVDRVELGFSDSNFMVWSAGPGVIFGLFEDAHDTGWFYLYDAKQRKILTSTHVYNRSQVSVEAKDVDVIWSSDRETCAVAVWGQFRAFLGLSNRVEMQKPVTDRDEHGFYEQEWPNGFAHLLLRDTESTEERNDGHSAH